MRSTHKFCCFVCCFVFSALLSSTEIVPAATFDDDVQFLKQHVETHVLSSADESAQIAVVPAYQGRVMTSSASGDQGMSLGWINRKLIASGQRVPHINAFGGEDRFWMGPEGGQFSIFFQQHDPFDLEHWQTPAPIDSEPYPIVKKTKNQITFTKKFKLTNYSGTIFSVDLLRQIKLLSRTDVAATLKTSVPNRLSLVAYQSENTIRNAGNKAWQKDTGLLSVWILGMFNPSPSTTIVIPFRQGPASKLGAIVNDDYFGKVPTDRLKITTGVLYFRGDGQYRSKIGLSPKRALPIVASYDSDNQLLTIVQYNQPADADQYVNSMWKFQDQPYAGDVINSYNDGPLEPGKPGLGPFYELETSSHAAALGPNKSLTHIHRTFHFQGEESDLNAIARKLLGVSLETIQSAL